MSKVLFILILLFYSPHTYTQSSTIDSIEKILSHDNSPISQIDYHLGLARMHMLGSGNLESGIFHAQSAIQIARSIHSKKYEAIATVFLGSLYYNLSQPFDSLFIRARELALQSKDPDAIGFSSYTWVETSVYDPPLGIQILEEVLEIHRNNISVKNLGNIYKAIAWEYEKNGEFYRAEQSYLTAAELFESIENNPEIDPELGRISAQLVDKGKGNLMQSRIYLGQLYSSQGRHNEAIKMGLKAFEATRSDSDHAYISAKIGEIYLTAGKMEESISNYNRAVQLYRNRNEPAFLATTLQALGHAYLIMNEYSEAEKRYVEAYELEKEVPNSAAEALLPLANLYKQTGRLEKSIETFIKADSIFESVDNEIARISCQLSIAEAQGEQGFYDLAFDKINSQIPLLEKIQDYHLQFKAYTNLSKIENLRNRYDDAIQHSHRALQIAIDHKDIGLISSGHKRLSITNRNAERYQDAYHHLIQHQIYKDSLFTLGALQKLKEEQVRQNIDEHINEKEKAEGIAAILESQNRIYLITSLLLLSLLTVGTYLFVQLRKTRKQLEGQNIQLQELNKTKDRFFGIIAHDIRSPILALESVDEQMQYYVKKGDINKVEKISGMVGSTARQLNALLDNLLNWALLQTGMIPYRPSQISIIDITTESISLLRTNASIKNITMEDSTLAPTLAYADSNAIQTIIRNLLGNAIKFSPTGSIVKIKGRTEAHKTIITIEDQGKGMSKEEVDKLFSIDKKSKKGTAGERGTGLGMILVKDLIELNKGSIQIDSKIGEGTKVNIYLPNTSLTS